MPFGLCNAPAAFQRMMDSILSGLKWKCCLVYLDDILIFSVNWENHLEDLQNVFQRLSTVGLSLMLSKCEFGINSTTYLGHLIEHGRILPDPSNVDAISQFPKPTSVTSVRSFLGMAGHCRRFVKNIADISLPLRILKKRTFHLYGESNKTVHLKH